jgi:hypothetical protein
MDAKGNNPAGSANMNRSENDFNRLFTFKLIPDQATRMELSS